MSLDGKKIAILIAPRGTEEPEFAKPKAAVEKAGGTIVVVGLEKGVAKTVNNDLDPGSAYPVDRAVDSVSAKDFDGLIVPGGCVGADKLRGSEPVVAFVRDFFAQRKPVAVICHGPWVLVEADVLEGRTLTSFPTVRSDIENAGGTWIDQEVVVDDGLVTSRNPDDLPAFCETIVETFARELEAEQAPAA